jgi:hypothetical protein
MLQQRTSLKRSVIFVLYTSSFIVCSQFLEQHSRDSKYCPILLLLEVDMWPEVPKNVGYIFGPKCKINTPETTMKLSGFELK